MKLCGRCSPVKKAFQSDAGVRVHNGYTHHGCPYCPFVSQGWTDWWTHLETKHADKEKYPSLAKKVEAVVEDLWEQMPDHERSLRRLLWLEHAGSLGHMPYGDDGEMQCCGIDFLRMSPAEIEESLRVKGWIKSAETTRKLTQAYNKAKAEA